MSSTYIFFHFPSLLKGMCIQLGLYIRKQGKKFDPKQADFNERNAFEKMLENQPEDAQGSLV